MSAAHTGEVSPTEIDRYRVVRLIGQGAFGRVYLAYDPRLNRQVAIKVPHSVHLTPQFLKRFELEGPTMAQISHPHVCMILDAGITPDGRPYFVFEYVDGPNLETYVTQLTRLRPAEAARIMLGVARGVAAAHAVRIIHRDLKPANVLMTSKELKPVVTDFGVARLVGRDGMTVDGQAIGTPAYMPPEQYLGQLERVTERSDVYALGVMLFELVSGRLPYRNMGEVVDKALTPPKLSATLPAVPPAVCAVAVRAMQKNPAARFPTAAEFADQLEGWLTTRPGPTSVRIPAAAGTAVQTATAPPRGGRRETAVADGPRFVESSVVPDAPRRSSGRLRAIVAGGAVGLGVAAAGIAVFEATAGRPAAKSAATPR